MRTTTMPHAGTAMPHPGGRARAGSRSAADAADAKAKTKVPRASVGGPVGWLAWVFPAMLALAALTILLSGRDLTQSFLDLAKETEGLEGFVRHPAVAWIQRGVSLLLLAASLERIVSHFTQRRSVPSVALTWTFLIYWLTTVAAPGVLGAHPMVSHEYAYSLLFGLAATLCGPEERERILAYSRNGLFLYVLAGIALTPVWPSMTLDTSYNQGLVPGLPRFGGLASHPVMMGLLTQTGLLLLWARPFERRWLNIAGWTLGLGVLFLAQSKTAWVAFMLSAMCMVVVRRTAPAVQRAGDPRQNSFGVGLCLVIIAAVFAVLVGTLVLDVPGMIGDFFNTREGAQLASLTGRDRIWVVALQEWSNHPVFGYGPTLWDSEYRQAIGMPNATHGHNQFIDTLARAGTVGAIGLSLYALVLAGMSIRYARATRGLSLAMFTTLALLSISEVPLMLAGYGTDVFTHLLLVVVLASAAAARPRATPTRVERVEPTLRTAR
jgi:O-antigen ligase